MTDFEKCGFKRCRQPASVTYLGKPVCDGHWHGTRDRELLRGLGLPVYEILSPSGTWLIVGPDIYDHWTGEKRKNARAKS